MSNIISQKIHKFLKTIVHTKTEGDDLGASLIKEEILKNKPSMIARFGSTEIKAILYPKIVWPIRTVVKKRVLNNMETLSGFFPSNEENIKKFSDMMIQDMKLLDILGSWRIEEHLLVNNLSQAKRINLTALEPYLNKDPWTEALEGKKILVIHPFNSTIENQYHTKRKRLFANEKVLPEFDTLQTIKAVQTVAGNRCGYNSWFEALDYMKNEIDKKDFDVAIIGCGAYGFPLAAHVKRIGKKAVHLGGPTQMLFGVKGKRWVEREEFKDLINEYFVYPTDEDKPKNSSLVEGGCYW